MTRKRQRKKDGTLHRPTGTPLDMRPKKGASPPSDPAARDTAWAAALRSTDEAAAGRAYAEIYTLYFRQMLAYGQRSCHLSATDAEDVTQDMFFRIWQRRRALRIRGTVERYLLRAMSNGARDRRRTDGRRADREDRAAMSGESTTEDELESAFNRAALITHVAVLLDSLPPRQRLIVTLRIMYGRTIGATADTIRVSESTVRGDLCRAVFHLRAALRAAAATGRAEDL